MSETGLLQDHARTPKGEKKRIRSRVGGRKGKSCGRAQEGCDGEERRTEIGGTRGQGGGGNPSFKREQVKGKPLIGKKGESGKCGKTRGKVEFKKKGTFIREGKRKGLLSWNERRKEMKNGGVARVRGKKACCSKKKGGSKGA